MRSIVVKLVFLFNILFYGLTAAITGDLINANAVINPRTYSWAEDWDIFAILSLLGVMNVLGGLYLFAPLQD